MMARSSISAGKDAGSALAAKQSSPAQNNYESTLMPFKGDVSTLGALPCLRLDVLDTPTSYEIHADGMFTLLTSLVMSFAQR